MQDKLALEIIPGILESDWREIEKKIELVRPFAKTLHIDLLDGKLVDNKTFLKAAPFKKYSQDFLLELHMMVEEPINFLDEFSEAGFRRFLGHVEKMGSQEEFVAKAQLLGEVGLAIDGPTQLTNISIDPNDLDAILFYTAKQIGFSGASMMDERLEKVKEFRTKYPYLPISVDGGVNLETIHKAKIAGATRFACTSALFKQDNIETAYYSLEGTLFKE